MINKFIVTTVASLALLGSTLAVADCPAYLNAEEGVPCNSAMTSEKSTETIAAKTHRATLTERETPSTNTESWIIMAQGE